MFYYVDILQSISHKMLYIGFTQNLRERFRSHNANENQATKNRGPWKLIFYEAYLNKYDALRREKYLKSTKGRTTTKTMLSEYFNEEQVILVSGEDE